MILFPRGGTDIRLMLEQRLIEERIADVEAGRVWTSDQIREKLEMFQ